MKLKKLVLVIILTILFTLLYANISMAKTATVDTETLNLRKEPSGSADILAQLDEGQKIEIIEEGEEWTKVETNGTTGYVSKEYIKISQDTTSTEEPDSNTKTDTPENEVTPNVESENKTQNKEPQTAVQTSTEPQPEVQPNTQPQSTMQTSTTTQTATFKIKNGTLNTDAQAYILPLINSSKTQLLKKDSKVTVMDEVNGWGYVQTEEISGWIRTSMINVEGAQTQPTNTPEPTTTENTSNNEGTTNNATSNQSENITTSETPIEEKTMYVNSESVYVRKGPGTDYEVEDSLILNDEVIVTAQVDDWYKVKTSEVEGYIAKRLLSNTRQETTSRGGEERVNSQEASIAQTTNTASGIGEEIVEFAKQFLGCPYVYGGSGPSTFDCSGFTMFVYENFGVNLSHSAIAQSQVGTPVDENELQPGDLVFFLDYETMDEIGHVGIYIGDGDFIHASSGTGYCVKISTLLTGSYRTRYDSAVRIF